MLRPLLGVAVLHVLAVLAILGYEVWTITSSSFKHAAAEEDLGTTMRAAQFDKVGDASVIQLVDIPRPKCCDATQVLVRVVSGGLNPVDFKQRRNPNPPQLRPLPSVSGFDFAGHVEQLGAEVRGFKSSDAVFGMLPLLGQRWGAFQEYVVVDYKIIAHAPRSMPLHEAAGLPLVGLTVIQALAPVLDTWQRLGTNSSGKAILIHAGAGGVGSFAIQYCKHVLGMYVTTTASSGKNELVLSLGADVVVDYRKTQFEEVVHSQDVVLDTVTHEYEARTFAKPTVLKQNGEGHYIHVLSTDWQPNSRETSPLSIFAPLLKKWGYSLIASILKRGVYYHCNPVSPDGIGMQRIAAVVDQGKVRPVTDKTFPLRDTAAAHAYLEQGRVSGKVLIEVTAA
ncbi:unnamed protein product [Polarella glacialis]|uniref:Enoyl reductase (ER) domain-containing protein n=1 Tax=Polarella glacialis TaxID=89957 RepID=A0A813IPB0_POLGL|nr:unnamed protein product [Polarella glacialis]